MKPSVERLKELFRYDEETGKLYWRVSKGPVKAGSEAGTITIKGYLRVTVDGKPHMVHNIIYAIYHNKWPHLEVDHRNRIRMDNSISNFREATRSDQIRNQVKNNALGFRGVYYCKDRISRPYYSQIRLNGKLRTLGFFATPQEAARAYDRAVIENLGPDFPTNANLGLLDEVSAA
ncbi:HNH endonuclease [Methylocystis sp. ATCC 49242]|uniref:HNH endonuclease n=1 Tax=Methylocystis sp. ATCC 49242 TaxID=622637 RepID=UPI0011848B0E|nr:HNH endonuclease [Methylocystis sp. ATCC 49242]